MQRAAAHAAVLRGVAGALFARVELLVDVALDDVLEGGAAVEEAQIALLHALLLPIPPPVLERRRDVRRRLALDDARQRALRANGAIAVATDELVVAGAGGEGARLEARVAALERVAQRLQVVLGPAALVLVHEEYHRAALARLRAAVVVERRRLGRLAGRPQPPCLVAAALGQAVRQPARAQLLALHLLDQPHAVAAERRQLLRGGALRRLGGVPRRLGVGRGRDEALLADGGGGVDQRLLGDDAHALLGRLPVLCQPLVLLLPLEQRHEQRGRRAAEGASRGRRRPGVAVVELLEQRLHAVAAALDRVAHGLPVGQRHVRERDARQGLAQVEPLLLAVVGKRGRRCAREEAPQVAVAPVDVGCRRHAAGV